MLAKLPMPFSRNYRSVLVTHYFVTGENGEAPELSDSESDVNVGGLDNVPAAVFRNFTYVALGHIHKPQHIGQGQVYYSGSPLKYSFSEALGNKSVNLVELGARGVSEVRREVLKPLREMRCIKGRLSDLMNAEVLAQTRESMEDYIQATLTDRSELIDPIGTLRSVYPNVLQILLEKNRSQEDGVTAFESRLLYVHMTTSVSFADLFVHGALIKINRK